MLAYTSVICVVEGGPALPPLDLDFDLFLNVSGTENEPDDRGST